MIINEEGTYTLRYTATDDCGKTTEVERELVVADTSPRRTVLYTDGTLIINERQVDEAHNIELHGEATNVYAPFDPDGATADDRYEFVSESSQPWNAQKSSIKSVEIGSDISPTNTTHWFDGMTMCQDMELSKLDTSASISMYCMFKNCSSLTSVDLSGFDTGSVTEMDSMFSNCSSLTSLDLSSFDTSKVTNMQSMFISCSAITTIDMSSFNTSLVDNMKSMFRNNQLLATIYASASFITTQVSVSQYMFNNMSTNLVGGAGTIWSDSNPKDKTYAHIDGGTSNPGYFTSKS